MRKSNNLLWISIFMFIVAISLLGCSDMQTKMNFSGESEHWSGELDTTVTKGAGENGEYIISYKRDNLEDVKWSKININDGKMIRQEDGLTSKSIQFPIISTEGSMASTEDDQIVVIEWKDTNGKKYQEDIILKAK
ncbi:hypothetical protein AB4Z30_10330 [Paenibacillus sp. 2TAF8]|uniref:hypothetical protein n=1 Tax=Paenibacillus sp. 2TAF8 TaxID=3233020 RepID=UPI003F9C3660